MLITFTTEHGHLVIRSEDLRRLEDIPDGCALGYLQHDRLFSEIVQGTAAENRDRIVAEETAAIAAYEDMQRRARQGPAQAVSRGRR